MARCVESHAWGWRRGRGSGSWVLRWRSARGEFIGGGLGGRVRVGVGVGGVRIGL